MKAVSGDTSTYRCGGQRSSGLPGGLTLSFPLNGGVFQHHPCEKFGCGFVASPTGWPPSLAAGCYMMPPAYDWRIDFKAVQLGPELTSGPQGRRRCPLIGA